MASGGIVIDTEAIDECSICRVSYRRRNTFRQRVSRRHRDAFRRAWYVRPAGMSR
jgi:hypothetical protein